MKKIVSILIVICLLFCLVGCGRSATTDNKFGRFIEVPNEKYLYYDVNTKVVYFINYGVEGYTYMSPYYASNGEVYLYTNGYLEASNDG